MLATRIITRILSFIMMAFLISACAGGKKIKHVESGTVGIATDNQWTLVPTPNSLDNAGIVITIDKKGVQTAIPGGRLDLLKLPGIIAVPQVTKVDNANFGILARFLSSPLQDSIAKAAIYDSAKFTATFAVSKGEYTRLDGDLAAAFEAKKASIENNIKLLNLEQNKIYLILETVSSDSIRIVIDNYNHGGVDILANINNWLNLHPSAEKRTSINKNLIYTSSSSPLIVLYKLRQINIESNGKRGPSYHVKATLGDVVTTPVVVK